MASNLNSKIQDFLDNFKIYIDNKTLNDFEDDKKNIAEFVYKQIQYMNDNHCYPFNQKTSKSNELWKDESDELNELALSLGQNDYVEQMKKLFPEMIRIKEIFEVVMTTHATSRNKTDVAKLVQPSDDVEQVVRYIMESIIEQHKNTFVKAYNESTSEYDDHNQDTQNRKTADQVKTLKAEMKKINVDSLFDAFIALLEENETKRFFSGDPTYNIEALKNAWKGHETKTNN